MKSVNGALLPLYMIGRACGSFCETCPLLVVERIFEKFGFGNGFAGMLTVKLFKSLFETNDFFAELRESSNLFLYCIV